MKATPMIMFLAATVLLLGLVFPAAVIHADETHGESHTPATGPSPVEDIAQTTCPVMTGNKIDPNIFTVYHGKKVYFCCAICKGKFQKDPEKYLGRLPQFGGTEVGAGGQHSEHNYGGISMAALIKPMGIATLSLVAITVCLGLFRRKNPKLLLKWHKRLGPTALLVGAIHAVLVMLAH